MGLCKDRILPKVEMDESSELDPTILSELFEMGLMGIEIPEEYGGAGGSFTTAVLAIEALAKVDPSVSVVSDVQNTLVNNALIRWGNPAQKEKYLPKMASEWVGSYALSEAGSGSDAFALKTRAEKRGDTYVLNGTKLWITHGGEASSSSSWLTLIQASVTRSASFIVEKGTPGLIGKKDKLGIERQYRELNLSIAKCQPKTYWVVRVGCKIAIETLNEGRIGIGAQMIGWRRVPKLRHELHAG